MELRLGKKDIVWTYLAKGLTIGVNVILLPLVLSFLTDIELGLWYVFASISQIVNLFDFGFRSTIARHMTYAWSGATTLEKVDIRKNNITNKRNDRLVLVVIRTCRIVYLVISLLALIAMLSFGTLYISKVLMPEQLERCFWSWIIYVIAVFINLFYVYYSSLLQGVGAIAELNKMSVYSKFIQIILAYVLLNAGMGLLGFVISYTASGITLRIIGKKYFEKYRKDVTDQEKITIKEIKECFITMWFTAWRDGIVMISQFLSTQANTLICAYYIDVEAASGYGMLVQITTLIAGVAQALYGAYQPLLSSSYIMNESEKQRTLICKTMFIYKFIYIFFFILFILIGIPVLRWIRPNMILDYKLIIIIGIFYYLYNQQGLFCSIISASNRIVYYRSYAITAIVSIIFSIIVTKYMQWGVIGLVIVQLLTNIAYNSWRWPLYVLKENNIRYLEIYTCGRHALDNMIKRFSK